MEGPKERYQFTWPDKSKAKLLANTPTTMTLRPCREESVDFDNTKNLYIEGDNLEVLKILRETYLGKVKMIYIDPPYNTGNDFVYNDDFSMSSAEYDEISGNRDEDNNRLVLNNPSNGRFHTDWLNMIYPRLKVAKDMLSDEGIIAISIDDNEITSLKFVCDEIFGASNCVGQITVVGNPRGRDYGGIARMHDYILVYKKSLNAVINLIEDDSNEFSMFDSRGGFELRELRNRNIKFNKENRPNLYYPFYINPNEKDENGLFTISLTPKEGWIEHYPLESQGINTVWRWGKEKSSQNINKEIAAKSMRNSGYMIVEKYRESRMMARSVWWDKDTNTEKGTLLVKELFDGKVFDYPKPIEMLMRLCEMGSSADSEDILMDFFSGSASFAHAVMNLNKKDNGNRQFILIQLPEKCIEDSIAKKSGYDTICDIGKERIRRAGFLINKENKQKTIDDIKLNVKVDVGFRVFKLDESNMKDVFYSPEDSKRMTLDDYVDNIKTDRTPEDLLFQVMLEHPPLDLSSKIDVENIDDNTVFSVDDGYLVACFDESLSEDVVTSIAKRDMKPAYVVFLDSSMKDDTLSNIEQIFRTYSPNTTVKIL